MKYSTPAGSDGKLATNGIHDATLHAIDFVSGVHFNVCLRDEDGQDKWFCFEEVAQLSAQGVVAGLIVCDLFAWKIGPSIQPTGRMEEGWHVLLGEGYSEEKFQLEVGRLARRYSGLRLALIEGANGGSIALVCRDILTEDEA